MEKANVRVIDSLIIAVTIVIIGIIGFVVMGGQSIGEDTADKSLFYFKTGKMISIDEDINFSSPKIIEAKDNMVIVLRNGTYYWKMIDAIPVDIVQINVTESYISLKLRWAGDRFDVVNSGNQSLSVDMYTKGGFTGRVILEDRGDEPVSEIVYIGFDENE